MLRSELVIHSEMFRSELVIHSLLRVFCFGFRSTATNRAEQKMW